MEAEKKTITQTMEKYSQTSPGPNSYTYENSQSGNILTQSGLGDNTKEVRFNWIKHKRCRKIIKSSIPKETKFKQNNSSEKMNAFESYTGKSFCSDERELQRFSKRQSILSNYDLESSSSFLDSLSDSYGEDKTGGTDDMNEMDMPNPGSIQHFQRLFYPAVPCKNCASCYEKFKLEIFGYQ